MATLNGMKPFPQSFNPMEEMEATPIPDEFDDESEYFETMHHNIMAVGPGLQLLPEKILAHLT